MRVQHRVECGRGVDVLLAVLRGQVGRVGRVVQGWMHMAYTHVFVSTPHSMDTYLISAIMLYLL